MVLTRSTLLSQRSSSASNAALLVYHGVGGLKPVAIF